MYRAIYRHLLARLPAERAHTLAVALLCFAYRMPGLAQLLGLRRPLRLPALQTTLFGKPLASPLGLAAGFDKHGTAFEALQGLGFGFVEIGTITGQAQPGNPTPRLFRLMDDQALLNRMGFNNDGAAAVAARLARRRTPGGVLGINIGKTKAVSEAEAIADYEASARLLAPYADYLVVNVSSPNTPGLRDLQAVDKLAPLLTAVRAACDAAVPTRKVPLLVKIAPDLADEDIDQVADLATALGLDGIIATNTTIRRDGLRSPNVAALGAGGISGPPVAARALAVLQRLRARVPATMTLISVGGISTADDIWARFAAGATAVQAYTALVYHGPRWPRRVAVELAQRLAAAKVTSLHELYAPNATPGSASRPAA